MVGTSVGVLAGRCGQRAAVPREKSKDRWWSLDLAAWIRAVLGVLGHELSISEPRCTDWYYR